MSSIHNAAATQLSRLKKNDEYLTLLNINLRHIEQGISRHFPHWQDSIFNFQLAQWIEALQGNNTVEQLTVNLDTTTNLGLWHERTIRSFLEAVAAVPTLEKLVLHQHTLGANGSFSGIRSAIQNARNVTHLAIHGTDIHQTANNNNDGHLEDLRALARIVRQKQQLKSFKFHGFVLGRDVDEGSAGGSGSGAPDAYVQALLPILENPSLQELELGNTSKGFLPLLEALAEANQNNNSSVENLTLGFVQALDDSVCDKLREVLLLNSSKIRSLSLLNQQNRRISGISEKGFQSLTALMEHNYTITDLRTHGGRNADIQFFCALNRAGRKRLFEPDATKEDWINVLCNLLEEEKEKEGQERNVEGIYYILQLNPCLCE